MSTTDRDPIAAAAPTAVAPTAPATSPRQWLALGVLALTALLLSLDVSVLYLALPELSADLGATTTQQLWILDIYSFVLAGFLVTMGALGDRIGRRRLLLAGAAGFGIASACAAYATSPGQLILWRAVLGIAGATLLPSTMGLLRTIFTTERSLTTAIGVWFSCFMGGMAAGPLVGGVLLEHFWWGSAFLLGIPFMVVLLVAGPRLLPESDRHVGGPVDIASSVLSLLTILPVIHAFKEVARGGNLWAAAGSAAYGIVMGGLFLRRQRRIANPLVDLTLFRGRVFSTALAVMLVGGVVMAGISFVSSQWLQLVAGLDPLGAGLWMLPANLALLLGSASSAAIGRRLGAGRTMALGLMICAAGLAIQTQVGVLAGVGLLVVGMALASFGIMLPSTLTMSVMMESAPRERAGSVASLSETSGELGVAVGVAGLGSLATFVYRDQLAPYAAQHPSDAGSVALDSLAGAVHGAVSVPGGVGRGLLEAAREAFTTSLEVVAGVGALVFVVVAVAAWHVLRERA
ncbi:MFS transporter [Intrasporangium oryzae NRRL B-24470]|uniref:MFS transporter n=1 Tax=Intrasporangium oryzae NRRL B-24470 TaxID=1386089 RepID=W9GAZ6_9MICO|nr:MFS transporter [Intrasporangium oryzae]EWT03250.1 MFS transporter [Intrasporangium oryzae NRRL B-24470]